jgi:hypothetical protein
VTVWLACSPCSPFPKWKICDRFVFPSQRQSLAVRPSPLRNRTSLDICVQELISPAVCNVAERDATRIRVGSCRFHKLQERVRFPLALPIVRSAAKSARIALRIARNGPILRLLSSNRTGESLVTNFLCQHWRLFLWRADRLMPHGLRDCLGPIKKKGCDPSNDSFPTFTAR